LHPYCAHTFVRYNKKAAAAAAAVTKENNNKNNNNVPHPGGLTSPSSIIWSQSQSSNVLF